jgi:hypothetical protein
LEILFIDQMEALFMQNPAHLHDVLAGDWPLALFKPNFTYNLFVSLQLHPAQESRNGLQSPARVDA